MLNLVSSNLKQVRDNAQCLLMGAPAVKQANVVAGRRVLLLPPADPGSLGDDAMVSGTLVGVQQVMGNIPLIVGTYRKDGWSGDFECKPQREHFWGAWRSINEAVSVFSRYSDFIVQGADVMDGFYSHSGTIRRLRYTQLAANLGLRARILGFSFNASPHPAVIRELAKVMPGVSFCLRDPVSFERFRRVCDADARLVADAAFLLEASGPTERTTAVWDFASAQRQAGRRVIGINAHLLFNKTHGVGSAESLARSLGILIQRNPDCAFVLIPHDYRAKVGDHVVLRRIHQVAACMERTMLVTEPLYPSEIKEICGYLDGTLTGRMHLAIASLGQGVPVAGIVYQGKFEGLMEHYELRDGLTIDPKSAADPDKIAAFFAAWLARLDVLAAQVRKKKPYLRQLAMANFSD